MERDWSSVRGRKIIVNKVRRYSWSNNELTILTNIQKIVSNEISKLDQSQHLPSKFNECNDTEANDINVSWITS